ncbi:MAG: hypothetical protein AAGI88_09190 [Pseudomonadota bacterium]
MSRNRRKSDRMPQHSEEYDRLTDMDGRLTTVETQLVAITQSQSRIEAAVLNKPSINWVGVVAMFISLLTLMGGWHLLTMSQVGLFLEPILDDVGDNAEELDIVKGDVRELIRDSAVQGEQIDRIDKYGSSNWIDYRREYFGSDNPGS